MEKVIYLVGFMGCGKTYWGRRLSEVKGYGFADLDAMIEAGEEKTITQIFEETGEAGFRETERYYLHQTGSFSQPTIVSTGGGAPCFFDNMDWMNRHGVTIFLDMPVPVLAERLWKGREKRPLLAGLERAEFEDFISVRLNTRLLFYMKAKHQVKWQEDENQLLQILLETLE